ncbi:MAG: GxxExxY protein [Flavitalea sp.]
MSELIAKEKTYQLIGICMDVHKTLGHGFSEIVYKDAIEYELISRNVFFEREKEYLVPYKNIILAHKFYADFVVYGDVILELKAAEGGLCAEFTSMLINYLRVSACKVGLLVNFGRKSLEYKRFVF